MSSWTALTRAVVDALPGQLGVYEIADADATIIKIGYAGGLEPFGLRSALGTELDNRAADGSFEFRLEFTHAYLTRWQELLMVYQATHGELPIECRELITPLGRLNPGSVR